MRAARSPLADTESEAVGGIRQSSVESKLIRAKGAEVAPQGKESASQGMEGAFPRY